MLIRFTVENFLSFKDETEFSMVPGKMRNHHEHILSNGKRSDIATLKTAVIYGANASGKSNLIKAIDFAKDIIVDGTRPNRQIPIKPFKFETACASKPSKFEFEFKYKGKAYNYGFVLDAEKIHEEWLYEITVTSQKQIFERKTHQDGESKVEFEFSMMKPTSAKDREFLAFTAKGTRPNQLFLTESIERNIKHFKHIYEWFDKILVVVFPSSHRSGLIVDFMTKEDFQQSLLNYLQLFDAGISGIHLRESILDEETAIPETIRDDVREEILKAKNKDARILVSGPTGSFMILGDKDTRLKALKLMTKHNIRSEDRTELLEVTDESDGTQRLLDLVPALMDLLNGEHVFVIDELDRSLHPHLSYKLLELFLTNKPQQKSQLIVSTHESSLLDLELLRRDEIWFVEKNNDGGSTMYSLEDFAPRYDKDIRKGYLLGRFGAIPFIKNVQNLSWVK